MAVRPRAATAAAILAAGLTAAALPAEEIAVLGDLVYTMAGDPIPGGIVLIADGKINHVGSAAATTIPAGMRTLTAAVVTPGFIDAHATVGFSGILNVEHDQDQLDTTEPLQPELRAIDGFDPREELIGFVRDLGVTTVHTGHGPGAVASGQTLIAKTTGDTVAEAVIEPLAMVAFTLGSGVADSFESPGTRSKGVAMLRGELIKAREYRDKRASAEADKVPDRDLRLEALLAVLDGEVPALVTAQQAPEIEAALRLAREFGFRLVLDGAAEAYLLLDQIAAAGVPVLVHPPMVRNYGETQNAAFDTAAKIRDAGIPFAFQSGFEWYVPKTRVVHLEAAIAAAHGLGRDAALEALTIGAARILGIDDRVGSLEPGKDADLALFDGDPLEYATHACAVVIDGVVVSETCK